MKTEDERDAFESECEFPRHREGGEKTSQGQNPPANGSSAPSLVSVVVSFDLGQGDQFEYLVDWFRILAISQKLRIHYLGASHDVNRLSRSDTEAIRTIIRIYFLGEAVPPNMQRWGTLVPTLPDDSPRENIRFTMCDVWIECDLFAPFVDDLLRCLTYTLSASSQVTSLPTSPKS